MTVQTTVDMMTEPPIQTRRMLLRFAPMIYGPTLLFGLGEGALLPLIPVIAADLGADVAQAALVATARGRPVDRQPPERLGGRAHRRTLDDGPRRTHRPRRSARGDLRAEPRHPVGLRLRNRPVRRRVRTRPACVHDQRVPIVYRARALSMLGGVFRLGMFLGPFVAAGLLAATGELLAAAWFFLACLVALILLVLFGRDPRMSSPRRAVFRAPMRSPASRTTSPTTPANRRPARSRRRATGCVPHDVALSRRARAPRLSAAALSGMRQARVYLLPLWGLSLGLDAQTIALIIGITGALEFALFYSSGQIMDRWGRLWAALPSMVLMSGAFLGLAFTHDADAATGWFIAAAVVIGIGNGLSSGILMTLGADVAPPADPAPFLGSWRTLTDAGGAAAPLIVSAATAVASLSLATGIIGVLGLAGAVGFAVYVPRYVPHRR